MKLLKDPKNADWENLAYSEYCMDDSDTSRSFSANLGGIDIHAKSGGVQNRMIRKDNWKLVFPHKCMSYKNVLPKNDGHPGKYSQIITEYALYNLRRDPGEEYDVKDLYPKIVQEIEIIAEKARNDFDYYNNLTSLDDVASVAKFAPYSSATVLSIGTTNEQGATITSNFLENKIIRFSYRWKFEDGEYSTLAPFTTSMFSRLGNADTVSLTAGNFGEIETFINAIKSVQLQVPTPTGYGIVEAELVYKETGSSALYVAESQAVSSTTTFVNFFYESQDPFRTIPSSQLTRVYDAVPRKAKTQELAGSRLIYGNFLQNYNIPDVSFNVTRTGETAARNDRIPYLSVKSRRTYQVGIVLADKFGRSTPVILSSTGGDSIYVDPAIGDADTTTAFNALRISFSQDQIDALKALDWAYSYKVVIKQREQEYYNWISIISGQDAVERLGDSINKIPRDQTAVIPPSTAASICLLYTSPSPRDS